MPDDHGKKDTGKDVTYHRTDGSPSGKLSSLTCVLGNEGKHRAVRNVSYSVSCIPDNVTNDEENCLKPCVRLRERKEYCCSSNNKCTRTDKDVGLKFTHLVLSSVCVDKGADHGVVDCVPDLNNEKKSRKKTCLKHHVSEPEGLNSTLETKAHVTAKVTGSIRNLVKHAKLALAVLIELNFFFHFDFFSFINF